MKCVNNGREDYDCWLRALEYTNSVYVKDICFYYDSGHGDVKIINFLYQFIILIIVIYF